MFILKKCNRYCTFLKLKIMNFLPMVTMTTNKTFTKMFMVFMFTTMIMMFMLRTLVMMFMLTTMITMLMLTAMITMLMLTTMVMMFMLTAIIIPIHFYTSYQTRVILFYVLIGNMLVY